MEIEPVSVQLLLPKENDQASQNWRLFAEVKVGSKLENIPDLPDESPIRFIGLEMHPGDSSAKERVIHLHLVNWKN